MNPHTCEKRPGQGEVVNWVSLRLKKMTPIHKPKGGGGTRASECVIGGPERACPFPFAERGKPCPLPPETVLQKGGIDGVNGEKRFPKSKQIKGTRNQRVP